MAGSVRRLTVAIPGAVGSLEAQVFARADAGKHAANGGDGGGVRRAAAVVCHPHSLYGGSMCDVTVATMTQTYLASADPVVDVVVNFNFRGVGNSGGAFHGENEVDDVLAVVRHLSTAYNGYRRPPNSGGGGGAMTAGDDGTLDIYLCGYSFGAFIAYRAACTMCWTPFMDASAGATRVAPVEGHRLSPRLVHLTSVGLPVEHFEPTHGCPADNRPTVPWLLLHGEHDDVASVASVRSFARTMAASGNVDPELVVIQGEGHFLGSAHAKAVLTSNVTRHLAAHNGSTHTPSPL